MGPKCKLRFSRTNRAVTKSEYLPLCDKRLRQEWEGGQFDFPFTSSSNNVGAWFFFLMGKSIAPSLSVLVGMHGHAADQ